MIDSPFQIKKISDSISGNRIIDISKLNEIVKVLTLHTNSCYRGAFVFLCNEEKHGL